MIHLLYIDGEAQEVQVESITRKATIVSGLNAGRMRSGDRFYDVIGTYYDYGFSVYPDYGQLDRYAALQRKIASAELQNTFIVPFGQGYMRFEGFINQANDHLETAISKTLWSDMAFTVEASGPERFAGEVWTPANATEGGALVVDGYGFDVAVSSLRRVAEVHENNSARNMYGKMNRYPIGTYQSYEMEIGTLGSHAQYDDLYYLLSAPVEYHDIEVRLPEGKIELRAHVSSISDKLIAVSKKEWLWGEMRLTFDAVNLGV